MAGQSTLEDRSHFKPLESIAYIWNELGLPSHALDAVDLEDSGQSFPSSFKLDHLAQTSIALSALSAALISSSLSHSPVPRVSVVPQHAAAEFISERLYTLNGKLPESTWGSIGGLHRTADGHVRIHDNFPNHKIAALKVLGCDIDRATRADVAKKCREWKALELEAVGMANEAVIYALRTFEQWDVLPQAQAVPHFPVALKRFDDGTAGHWPLHMPRHTDRCLRGLRVIELSRVIAAPVAGRTLAAHGADVLWVTSPKLPDLPALDRDLARGKRTIQLDLDDSSDASTLRDLVRGADVFIQSYRPGALASKGFGFEEVASLRPGILYASLSAWGHEGPWSKSRGFDSMVQTVSGMNVSEAEHFGDGSPAKVTPCQALDHAAGYLLATGISAALYRRVNEGGSWEVHVSLAGVMKYLRSLGQYPGRNGFDRDDMALHRTSATIMETRPSEFGELKAVKHSAQIDGKPPGWDVMPKKLGSDDPVWLDETQAPRVLSAVHEMDTASVGS